MRIVYHRMLHIHKNSLQIYKRYYVSYIYVHTTFVLQNSSSTSTNSIQQTASHKITHKCFIKSHIKSSRYNFFKHRKRKKKKKALQNSMYSNACVCKNWSVETFFIGCFWKISFHRAFIPLSLSSGNTLQSSELRDMKLFWKTLKIYKTWERLFVIWEAFFILFNWVRESQQRRRLSKNSIKGKCWRNKTSISLKI